VTSSSDEEHPPVPKKKPVAAKPTVSKAKKSNFNAPRTNNTPQTSSSSGNTHMVAVSGTLYIDPNSLDSAMGAYISKNYDNGTHRC